MRPTAHGLTRPVHAIACNAIAPVCMACERWDVSMAAGARPCARRVDTHRGWPTKNRPTSTMMKSISSNCSLQADNGGDEASSVAQAPPCCHSPCHVQASSLHFKRWIHSINTSHCSCMHELPQIYWAAACMWRVCRCAAIVDVPSILVTINSHTGAACDSSTSGEARGGRTGAP